MKHNQGFTLIELIIVIVILGILAVTAAPKFLDFSSDARESTLTGVKGALESAGALVYGKAIIAGVQGAELACFSSGNVAALPTGETECGADATDVVYGYPSADAASLRAVAELSDDEWTIAVSGSVATITPEGFTASGTDKCEVTYTEATSSAKPVIAVDVDGC